MGARRKDYERWRAGILGAPGFGNRSCRTGEIWTDNISVFPPMPRLDMAKADLRDSATLAIQVADDVSFTLLRSAHSTRRIWTSEPVSLEHLHVATS